MWKTGRALFQSLVVPRTPVTLSPSPAGKRLLMLSLYKHVVLKRYTILCGICLYSSKLTYFAFQGCLHKLRDWFARNYLSTGAGVVTMFIIQVQYIQGANTKHTSTMFTLTLTVCCFVPGRKSFFGEMMFRAVRVTKLNNKLKKVKMLSRPLKIAVIIFILL